MKGIIRTNIVRTLGFMVAVSVCVVTSAYGANAVTSVSSERSTGGLTPAAYWDQQLRLHEWLLAELPEGTLDVPIRVPFTESDRRAMANDRSPLPRPLRVGIVKRVGRTIELWRGGPTSMAPRRLAHGIIRRADDGGFTWALALDSQGASALRVHLSDVSLPDTADIYFFSLDGQAYGPYRGREAFWSNSVIGSQGILLVRHFGPPAAGAGPMSLSVTSVGNIGARAAAAPEGLCSYNTECVKNAEAYQSDPLVADLMAATAYIEWVQGAWVYSCSGGLLADRDTTSEIPYFLTANHCLKSNSTAASMELFWNYTLSDDGCSGPIEPVTMGATVKATGVKGDFTLLELQQDPPSGSVFMGWSSEEIAYTPGAALHRVHHPRGAPQSYTTHEIDPDFQTCGGLPRPQFIYSQDTLGYTEAGSSGSLVTNAAGQVVGQLYGGCGAGQGNVCNYDGWRSVDGAFAFYFDKVAKFLASSCTPEPIEICDDGVDNDCNADIDCNDSACAALPVCDEPPPDCGSKHSACSVDQDCCSMICKPNGRCR